MHGFLRDGSVVVVANSLSVGTLYDINLEFYPNKEIRWNRTKRRTENPDQRPIKKKRTPSKDKEKTKPTAQPRHWSLPKSLGTSKRRSPSLQRTDENSQVESLDSGPRWDYYWRQPVEGEDIVPVYDHEIEVFFAPKEKKAKEMAASLPGQIGGAMGLRESSRRYGKSPSLPSTDSDQEGPAPRREKPA
ncbi:unnamed protein product [Bursaphelenchus okinawaensis]|uniref:Uncharacterized protein n=1 Tax=Bursaphelenchus okinawaensis TaxID=465554 RepID=A0A811KAF3_9BILA|nr:unnamed protein product [Bursaphelenchus okinawaensis]CAG9094749.1 unnamed protein product [Bursaphelenchus okinawaensis]